MIRRRSDNQTDTVTPPKRQRITLNRKNPHESIDTNSLLGATTRHNIQQQSRKPISKPQHLSSQQRTTTREPEPPQPQNEECSNYGHQGLSGRLDLHRNSDAPDSIGSIILYMRALEKWYDLKGKRIYSAQSPTYDLTLRESMYLMNYIFSIQFGILPFF